MCQITDGKHSFPSGYIRVRGIWHTGVSFVVKVDKAENSIVTFTQLKRRDKWLEQVGEKSAEQVQVS